MLRRFLILPSMLTLTLSACVSSDGGSLSHYVGTAKVNVETRCGGGYQVFRYGDEQRVLVAAYAISQAYKSACERYNPGPATLGITGARYEEAVTEYFAKTPALKDCRITGGTNITPLHSEFTFSCPPAPAAAPAPQPPKGKKR